jgi:hypothetical protein
VELVGPLVAAQGVVAEVAGVEDVPSLAAPEDVVAGVARPATSEHAAVHQVVRLLTGDLIEPVAALQGVPALAAADDVVPTVAPDLIGTAARGDHVVPRFAVRGREGSALGGDEPAVTPRASWDGRRQGS